MAIKVAKFKDVSAGTNPGQFTIGDRDQVSSLQDLDPTFKMLMDDPVTAVIGVTSPSGLINLTPVWFSYDGSQVLLNLAEHRKKTDWIRTNPNVTYLLMNPANAYHWMSLKCTVNREIHEDDPNEGAMVTEHLNSIWRKYIGQGDTYQLRDPGMNERRVLFVLDVTQIATFGVP
jgi:hypothetical protein